MEEKISQTKNQYSEKIQKAQTLKELDEFFLSLFGKNGVITKLTKELPQLSGDERRRVGPLFNTVKDELERAIETRRRKVREEGYKKLEQEALDLTTPIEIKKRTGHLHPLTAFEKKIADHFSKLGFRQYDAPQIDTDYITFQVLNIPEVSPARDLQDTFYVDTKNPQKGDKLVLRSHTSNSEVRIMKEFKPPIRMMVIGRCFRYENLTPKNDHTFDQFEIVYIDKGVNMGNLQYLSEYFLKEVFGTEIRARMRTKYYPQVEPGAGIDGLCIFCKGKGCKVCGGVGWLELGGAGMIHPVALKNGGIDPNKYSGLAWGISPERMVMLIEGIEDIRLFRSGDLKFLEKF